MGVDAVEPGPELRRVVSVGPVGQLVEQPVDPCLVRGRHLKIAVVIESVGDAGGVECGGEVGYVVVVEVPEFVRHPGRVGSQRRGCGHHHGVHELVHLLLVGLAHDEHRALPGVRQAGTQQQALHHRAGLRGVPVQVVLQLILAGFAHFGGVRRRAVHGGNTALHAGRHLGRVARAALETPDLRLGASHTAAAHNHAPMLTRRGPIPNTCALLRRPATHQTRLHPNTYALVQRPATHQTRLHKTQCDSDCPPSRAPTGRPRVAHTGR